MHGQFPLGVAKVKDRLRHLDVFETAPVSNDMKLFVGFVAETVVTKFKCWLAGAEPYLQTDESLELR